MPDTSPEGTTGGRAKSRPLPWLDSVGVQSRWDDQFRHHWGTFGYPFHLVFAVLWCFACVGPPVFVELLGLPLVVVWLSRVWCTWCGLRDVLLQPTSIAIALWLGWMLLAGTWSSSLEQWAHEVSYVRWAWAGFALWAVLDRRDLLIAALCAGFAAAQLAQLGEFLGYRYAQGWVREALVWSHPLGADLSKRVSGWWHQPAVGGAMLVAALGLHLGPALLGAGWRRWAGLAGVLAAWAAILATGTRGAMLAGAALSGIMLLTAIWATLARSKALGRRPALVVAVMGACGVVVLAAVWATSPGVQERARQASEQVSQALHEGDYDSDMGGRLLAARAAVDAGLAHPLRGVGPGGFLEHVRGYARAHNVAIQDWRVDKLKTAHNTLLHAWATTGAVGVVLLASLGLLMLWSGLRPHAGMAWAAWLGTYGAGPGVALLGLALAGCVETLHLNMSTAALITTLIGLSPLVRPRVWRGGAGG